MAIDPTLGAIITTFITTTLSGGILMKFLNWRSKNKQAAIAESKADSLELKTHLYDELEELREEVKALRIEVQQSIVRNNEEKVRLMTTNKELEIHNKYLREKIIKLEQEIKELKDERTV